MSSNFAPVVSPKAAATKDFNFCGGHSKFSAQYTLEDLSSVRERMSRLVKEISNATPSAIPALNKALNSEVESLRQITWHCEYSNEYSKLCLSAQTGTVMRFWVFDPAQARITDITIIVGTPKASALRRLIDDEKLSIYAIERVSGGVDAHAIVEHLIEDAIAQMGK